MEGVEKCPKCKTDTYKKPNMKLMISVCGHSLCETCVKQRYGRGPTQCFECSRTVKLSDYRDQIYEDTYVEKEIEIRKKLLKDFHETEDDFPTLKEFNDYLEKVETFVFNLANNFEEEKTLDEIEKFKQQIKENRVKNKPKLESKGKPIEYPQFVYVPYTMDLVGPTMHSNEELNSRFVQNCMPIYVSSHRPGGFLPITPVKRSIQEAFSGLYVTIKQPQQMPID